jgi:hypothetical protein
VAEKWYNASNYLALLAARDENELVEIAYRAAEQGVRFAIFKEPDIGNKITAIALEPGNKSKKICQKLPLTLQSLGGQKTNGTHMIGRNTNYRTSA